jgi:membrane associated rhomboid family serine protease
MSATEPEAHAQAQEQVATCYRHADTPTRLRCSRCERPICGRCATPASVGQHCPECVAEARRTAPRVRSALRGSAPAVFFILLFNIVVFVAQILSPGGGITLRFGLAPPEIAQGEWWRLITPMFLHSPGFLLHIAMNSIILLSFGSQVERAFGTVRFVAIYLITGFVASATSYAFSACNILGVGASGAIAGTIGVLLVYLYKRRRSQFVRAYMNQLIGLIVLNAVIGLMLQGIDNYAHGGGLAAGIAAGLLVDRENDPPSPWLQALALAGVLAVGIALTVWRTTTFGC